MNDIITVNAKILIKFYHTKKHIYFKNKLSHLKRNVRLKKKRISSNYYIIMISVKVIGSSGVRMRTS